MVQEPARHPSGREEGIMRIVLGLDDSPHARAALAWVCRAKWPEGTRVEVVSVLTPPHVMYAEGFAAPVAYPSQLVEELTRHHEELGRRAEAELKEAGLASSSKVIQGDAREVLTEVARSSSADLIVVGSHGRSGLAKLLLGSVATHVVTHAPCDVLVVKRPADH